MNTMRAMLLVILTASLFSPARGQSNIPDGWFMGGDNVGAYEVASDLTVVHSGYASAVLRSRRAVVPGFGTIAQIIKADEFLNKRVRFSAYVRTGQISGSAGLWMRVDDRDHSSQPLSFDNMHDRPIQGNTDWRRYDIVLDVPREAGTITFGVLLNGGGTVWLDDVTLEVVDQSVPSTDIEARRRQLPDKPRNLDFEQ